MLETSIRTLASLLFTVIICVSFLSFLTASKVRTTLLEPSFYTQVLEENDSYQAIQAGLISEIRDSEEVGGLRDDLGMDVNEFESLAQEVIPVPYLKTQLDGIITGVMSYLRGEVEDPQLFVELAHPIESMRSASLDYVDRRVESVEQTQPTTVEDYAREARNLIDLIEGGAIPSSAPSLASVPQPLLEDAIDQVLPVLSRLEPQTAASLEANWPEVRATLLEQPDSPEAMKLAARSVASPYIDEAIAEIRTHLDDRDRFDLVVAAAEASDMPRDQFIEDVDKVRDPVNALQGVGPTISLVIMAVATVLLALVNMPHRASMILWPSIILIVTGIIAIVVSALLSATLPTATHEICGDASDFVCEPVVDVLRELTRSMTDFPMLPSIALIVLGVLGATLATIIIFAADFGGGSTGDRRPGNMSESKPKEGW